MKDHVRAAVAAAALSHASGKRISHVYDYSASRHRNVQASVAGQRLNAYDYDSSSHFSGNLPNLYHYGESCHVQLRSKGNGVYDGYDYGASCHYQVKVTGSRADIYDYGVAGYFTYSA